ncbi:MAG: hypothetical protein MUC34_02280 [Anaerolineae bacterium]|nr:hypothetical protein [Anaerolineae bacterium]
MSGLGAGIFGYGHLRGVAAALSSIKLMEKDDGALYEQWDANQACLAQGLKEIARRCRAARRYARP